MTQAQETAEVLRSRLVAELSRPAFHGFIRPYAIDVNLAQRSVSIGIPFRPEFKFRDDQPGIHGGVISAIADLSVYAVTAVFSGCVSPTVSLSVDFLNLAADADMVSSAHIIKMGRQLAWAQADIFCDNKQVAVAKAVLLLKEKNI